MIGRRTAAGLSLLCALLFSAIAVQSASAAKSTNTTAFTCVKGVGNEDFEDAHCDKNVGAGNGEYGHELIPLGTTTKFEGVQLSNAVFRSKSAGAAIEFTCTTVEATGSLHNVESGGAGSKKHTVTGNLKTTFNNCTVNKPAKCTVATPIETNTEFEGVDGLGAGGNEMGVEHKPEGGGATFLELSFKDKGAEQCALEPPSPFPITGTMVQTGAVAPTEKHTGATWNFTQAMTTETLKFFGEKAGFAVTTTLKMDPNEGPITLTTVT